MFTFQGFAPNSTPFPLRTSEGYQQACAACERRVAVSVAEHAELKVTLAYDKRRDGAKGRGLTRDVGQLGLQAKDRLEPSLALPDVGKFEHLRSFPAPVSWWRPAN